jgi:transposase
VVKVSRNKFTKEFKNTILDLHNAGKSIPELSSEYAVSVSTINNWIRKSKPVTTTDDGKVITVEQYEELIRKSAKQAEEIEILKKALGIFAKK